MKRFFCFFFLLVSLCVAHAQPQPATQLPAVPTKVEGLIITPVPIEQIDLTELLGIQMLTALKASKPQ